MPIHPEWRHVAGSVLGLTALLCLLLAAFAWPAANTAPRNLPVAVGGPPQVAAQIEEKLGAEAFDVTRVEDRVSAVQMIESREVYGAIVAGPDGAELLTASAGGPVVAQLLNQVASGMAAAQGQAITVTDVVPLPKDDPRGAGLAAGALPLVLGGIATAAALALGVRGRWPRIVGIAGVAAAAGLALTAILQFWLGSLEGSYWLNASVVALSIAATSSFVLGLERLLGRAGLGLGAAVMMLLGNPLSGLTSAPELLPSGWGALGQLMPPGAGGTALRSVSFFEGAGSGSALLVLAVWLAVGLALCLLPGRPAQQPVVATAPEPAVA